MKFSDLGLDSVFVERLAARGIVEPSEIQRETFLPILEGKSVLGYAKTGTGKTLGYMAPLLQRLQRDEKADGDEQDSTSKTCIRVLVLVPTRELAAQVGSDLELLTASQDCGVVVVGGESEEKQISGGLKADWVIATPGRLLDLLKRKALDLSSVGAVVFDEADRLMDMGFVDDMREIMRRLPKVEQLLFFSATVHFGVDEMAYEFGVPDILRIGKETDELIVENLDHRIAYVGDDEKFHALAHFVAKHEKQRGIIFSNYRDKAAKVAGRLKGLGCRAETLTAQLNQKQRSKIMEDFRTGQTQLLVASDLAARGLDIFDIDYVVNFDVPEDPATYVHRVGRTARAGRKGLAVSLVGFDDAFRVERLEKFLGGKVERYDFSDKELSGRLPRLGPPAAREETNRDSKGKRTVENQKTSRPQERAAVGHPTPKRESSRSKNKGFMTWILALIKKIFGISSGVDLDLEAPSKGGDSSANNKKGRRRRRGNQNSRGGRTAASGRGGGGRSSSGGGSRSRSGGRSSRRGGPSRGRRGGRPGSGPRPNGGGGSSSSSSSSSSS